MKRYKLLKDLPTFKAGQLAYISKIGNLIAGNPDKPEITDAGVQLMMYHKTTLDKFPEILTEWFEEIKEPTDSIHWKPKDGEEYWYIGDDSSIRSIRFSSYDGDDVNRLAIGNVYLTKAEAICVRERKLAEVRLRRTSNFKPDLEKCKGGWVINYDYCAGILSYTHIYSTSRGEPVYYATREEAEKSIRENERDWKIYFGIKED